MLGAFERAELEPDNARRRYWLTFVIVGAGPTGVEMVGTLAELARGTLAGEFRHIDPRTARVILVESKAQVLPSFPSRLSKKALRSLQRLGVEIMTEHVVLALDGEGLR